MVSLERTLKMAVEHLLQFFFPVYCNLRDIKACLICKLHNDTQLVMSHCILSFENTAARPRNLIEKCGKVT